MGSFSDNFFVNLNLPQLDPSEEPPLRRVHHKSFTESRSEPPLSGSDTYTSLHLPYQTQTPLVGLVHQTWFRLSDTGRTTRLPFRGTLSPEPPTRHEWFHYTYDGHNEELKHVLSA